MTHWETSDATEEFPAVGPDPAPGTPQSSAPTTAVAVADDPAAPPPDRENVTCPECGAPAVVTVNRRQAEDFCRHCDYPLFWTPSLVVLDSGGLGQDSLRRLPGTTGRAMTASISCPHCAEPNPLTAVNCVRCGQPMHVQAPPPAPVPVYAPPPPAPAPAPPEKHVPWWVWLLVGLIVAAAITVGILVGTGTIG